MIKFRNLLKYFLTSLGAVAFINLAAYADLGFRQEGDDIIYQISSLEDLKDFSQIVSNENNFANAELVCDIDFSENIGGNNKLGESNIQVLEDSISGEDDVEDETQNNTDAEKTSVGFLKIGSSKSQFSGTFDGLGHKIKNVNNIDNHEEAVLFGFVGTEGVIKDLILENFYIKSNYDIAGLCYINNGLIDGCVFDGQIYGNENIASMCFQNNGKIIDCITKGCIIGNKYVGGVCVINKGVVENCFNMSRIYAYECAGGLVAKNEALVKCCANLGYVSGNKKIGTFIGIHTGNLILDCCNINNEFICDVGVANCTLRDENRPEDGMILSNESKEKYRFYINQYVTFLENTNQGMYFDRNQETLKLLEDLLNSF